MADGRARSWTFIVYPGEICDNWRTMLDSLHLEWVESPFHDKDLNPTGEEKKPHIHVLVQFTNVKSYDQLVDILRNSFNHGKSETIPGCTYPQKCHNVKGLIRYFMHWDNPEKYRYSVTDLVCHGGACVDDYLKPSPSERYEMIGEIEQFIEDNRILEISEINAIARDCYPDTWHCVLCDPGASSIIRYHIQSLRNRLAKAERAHN